MTRPIIALTGRKGSFSRRSAEVYFYDVAHALERAGALGVLVPMTESGTILDEHVARFDGLILQGGDDVCPLLYGEDASEDVMVDCERDRFEAALAKRFLTAGKPLLGICRGMQLLNVVMGGTLSQNVSGSIAHMLDHHRNGCHVYAHRINIAPDGFLAGILGSSEGVPVNSFHRQGIRRLGEGLIIEATAADGLPEAISLEWRDDVLGVQWHPEWLDDAVSHRIFAHFSAVCVRRGASSGISSTSLERMNTTELHLDLRGNVA